MAATDKPGIVEQGTVDHNLLEFGNNLLTMESMDRSSPEMWPEKVAGVNAFINDYTNKSRPASKILYSKELNQEDQNYMQQLSSLSSANLIAKVKELHDIAYQLGVEESKEVTRGKYLNIFNKSSSSDI